MNTLSGKLRLKLAKSELLTVKSPDF